MRRFFLITALLLAAGCQNVEGPRAHRDNPVRVDDPRLTLEEQKRLERDRLAIPLESPNVGPPTYFQSPGAPDPNAVRGH
jgi:hypothetical protein